MNWLSFFIGVLVGWIVEWLIDLFYWRRKYQACCEEREALQVRLAEAERRLRTFQVKGREVDLDVDLEAPEVEVPTIQRPDDLKRIEGIGPKISRLLMDNGILTFAQLAATSSDRLWAILQEAGPRFQLANPESWPEQARLAADGAWDELRAFQGRLFGGRRSWRWDR